MSSLISEILEINHEVFRLIGRELNPNDEGDHSPGGSVTDGVLVEDARFDRAFSSRRRSALVPREAEKISASNAMCVGTPM
jgi:hypothetical protein